MLLWFNNGIHARFLVDMIANYLVKEPILPDDLSTNVKEFLSQCLTRNIEE